MEAMAINQGILELEFKQHTTHTLSTHIIIFTNGATKVLGIHHVFPYVGQEVYPMERTDGIQGHCLKLTQVPKYILVDGFGFKTNNFQFTLWCDADFRKSRVEI